MFAAHNDGFFRACVHAEAAVNAPHHVDIEPIWKLFDFGIWMFARFNVDALGRTDRRAHVTGNAFKAAIVTNSENVGSAETFRVRTGLFGVIDGRGIPLEQTREKPPEGDRKCSKRGPNGKIFATRSVTDIDSWHVYGVTAFDRRHRATSTC